MVAFINKKIHIIILRQPEGLLFLSPHALMYLYSKDWMRDSLPSAASVCESSDRKGKIGHVHIYSSVRTRTV